MITQGEKPKKLQLWEKLFILSPNPNPNEDFPFFFINYNINKKDEGLYLNVSSDISDWF